MPLIVLILVGCLTALVMAYITRPKSRVDYKKIERLEIETGIVERPSTAVQSLPVVDTIVKDCYFSNPVLYESRCIVSSVPINPTTGEELHIQPQLQFVSEDDPYPEI